MNKAALESILEKMVSIKKNGPSYPASGICFNLLEDCDCEYFHDFEDFLEDNFPKWKHYSGESSYPIKVSKMSCEDAYCTLNKWEGSYGRLRMQLLNFLIKTAKQELKDWKD